MVFWLIGLDAPIKKVVIYIFFKMSKKLGKKSRMYIRIFYVLEHQIWGRGCTHGPVKTYLVK
jgi:hypothetical protein